MGHTTITVPQAVVDLFRQIDTSLREKDRFTLPPHLEQHVQNYVNYKKTHRTLDVPVTQAFYRARIHSPSQQDSYKLSEVGAPPMGVANSGRLNPEGIPFLYLADSTDTAIAEVRPWKSAAISVGCFKPTRVLRVAQLMASNSVVGSSEISEHGFGLIAGMLFEALYFSVPTHRDDRYAYLPTQYIASKFKSAGIDGLQYESVLREKGTNTAFFDPGSCQCESVEVFEVSGVEYKHARRVA